MAELTPIPAAQRPAEPGYQPLSGYAVAAIMVAGAFALALVILVGIGLWSRRTPLSYGLLVVPLTGLVLSVLARSHIRNAEGTRTGVKLANSAWWICVLGGAGFAAFLAANDLALRRESQRQADAMFEMLRAGREQEAFVRYVLPPELRGRADPGTPEFEQVYAPFGYLGYVNHPLIHSFRQHGTDARAEHVFAKDVGEEGEGFKATHKYRITIPEGVFTVQLKMVAAEPRGGGRPEWHVELGRALGITSPSPSDWEYFSQFGRLEMETQDEAEKVAREWMTHFSAGRHGQAQLYTQPRDERQSGDAVLSAAAVLAGGPLLAESIGAPGQPRPTADEALKAGLFRKDMTGTPLAGAQADELRQAWASLAITPVSAGRRAALGMPETGERTTFTLNPSDVTVTIPIDLSFGLGGRKMAPGAVGLVCSDPALVTQLTTAKAQGASAKDDGSVTLRTLPPRDWRVAWVRTTMEPPRPPSMSIGKPGPDNPGGPSGPPGQ